MKISITQLPTNHYLAGGERLNDWAQWRIGEQPRDEHFFVGSSPKFRIELRKCPRKWLKTGPKHMKHTPQLRQDDRGDLFMQENRGRDIKARTPCFASFLS
jgi:hypothetical protein